MVDRVHADAVAQQRTAGLAPRRIDRDHGNRQRVLLVQPETADQLVRQRRLAGATRPRNAEHRRGGGLRPGMEGLDQRRVGAAVLERGHQLGQRAAVATGHGIERGGRVTGQVDIAALHHVRDHAGQAHALAVLGAVDARHAVGLQLADLVRHDHAAAAAEHLDVLAAVLAQQIDHVFEVFDVPALIAGDGDALGILLQRGGHHLVHGAVVAQVDHLAAVGLEDAPHDVDRGVMAVEQRGGSYKPHLVGRRGGRGGRHGALARGCARLGRGPAHIGKISHCLHRSDMWLACHAPAVLTTALTGPDDYMTFTLT
ncbi:hypothetical protein D3C72_1036810 [compost metagenome]